MSARAGATGGEVIGVSDGGGASVGCGDWMPEGEGLSHQRCVRRRGHGGLHRSETGRSWADTSTIYDSGDLSHLLHIEREAHAETRAYLARALRSATHWQQEAQRLGPGGGGAGGVGGGGVPVPVLVLALAALDSLGHATSRLVAEDPPPIAEVRGQLGIAHDRLTRLLAEVTGLLPLGGRGEGG